MIGKLIFLGFIALLAIGAIYGSDESNEYPQIDPGIYFIGTQERAVAEYLDCWKDEDWDGMLEFTQKSWTHTLGQYGDPNEILKTKYGNKQLLGAEITGKADLSAFGACEDQVRATIYYREDGTIVQKEFIARIIRESAPFQNSIRGDWGVNPIISTEE